MNGLGSNVPKVSAQWQIFGIAQACRSRVV